MNGSTCGGQKQNRITTDKSFLNEYLENLPVTSRRNRVNHLGGVFLSKIFTFAFKFLKFAHFLAHLGGGGGVTPLTPPPPSFRPLSVTLC